MANSRVYLDHNASTALLEAARQDMLVAMNLTGNPSSVHANGRALANMVEKARSNVADLVGAESSQIVFTSSASEAITQGIVGSVNHLGVKKIFLSAGEHAAVVAAAKISGVEIEYIALDENGIIDLDALRNALGAYERFENTALVCVHLVNGETGIVQPIEEIAALVEKTRHLLLVDGVQAFGKMPIKFSASEFDMLAISAHKMGGPAGVGALVIKEHCNSAKIIPGGGQEMGRRGGTPSVMLIAGFGAAAADILRFYDRDKLGGLIDRFETGLLELDEGAVIFGSKAKRIGSVCYFAIAGISSETALISLDLNGIAVSAGSACSSGKISVSSVLKAMKIPNDMAKCALRISVGWNSSENDIDLALAALAKLFAKHKKEQQIITPQIGKSS